MKESIALLILLAAASSSFAQSTLPASGLSAALQAKATATTFILDQADSYCTVSPISNDGYLITALHCVRSCLEAAKLSETGSDSFVGLQELFVSTHSKAVNTFCKDINIPALGIQGVTVLETGSALSQFDAQFVSTFPNLYKELKNRGFDRRANDYAILKVNPVRTLACWPLSKAAAPAAANIWALGYPLPADISKQKPVLKASAGRVYASALESRAYASAESPDEQAYLTALYSEAGVLYSNASNQFGQSGGPVIAADGSVVGVVSGFTTVTLKDNSEIHELVASSTESILKEITPALAATLLKKSAACR
jgi:hypothetical protein